MFELLWDFSSCHFIECADLTKPQSAERTHNIAKAHVRKHFVERQDWRQHATSASAASTVPRPLAVASESTAVVEWLCCAPSDAGDGSRPWSLQGPSSSRDARSFVLMLRQLAPQGWGWTAAAAGCRSLLRAHAWIRQVRQASRVATIRSANRSAICPSPSLLKVVLKMYYRYRAVLIQRRVHDGDKDYWFGLQKATGTVVATGSDHKRYWCEFKKGQEQIHLDC